MNRETIFTSHIENGDGRTVFVHVYFDDDATYKPEEERIQMGLSWDKKYGHEGYQMFPAYFTKDIEKVSGDFCMQMEHGRSQAWSTVSAKAMKEVVRLITTEW